MKSLSGTPISEAHADGLLAITGLIGLGALILIVAGLVRIVIHLYLEGRPPK